VARQPDPDLEDRILRAARRLWRKGAENALTMRAVAEAAHTNTPAVYRRFATRDDILRALLRQSRQELFQEMQTASSVEDACRRYVDFAVKRPHEYELHYLHEHDLFVGGKPRSKNKLNQTVKQSRPVVEFMKARLAAQLGGAPDDYTALTLALWALLHGTAVLLITKAIPPQYAAEMRAACSKSIDTLLREGRRAAG
jgi:AcrR family transcriptional regulator